MVPYICAALFDPSSRALILVAPATCTSHLSLAQSEGLSQDPVVIVSAEGTM